MASFNFTFDPGTSLQQMIGVEVAGRIWSQYLVDNVNINIHVGVSSSLPTNVIGGALPAFTTGVSYSNVRNAMGADRRSTDDFTAFNHLSTAATQTVNFDWMTTGASAVWQQASTQRSMNRLNLTNANAKALGLAANGANLDGYILLSSNAPWNYNFTRSSALASTQLDFLSTAMHEIGHVLGFISGVDDPGWTMDVYDAYYWGQLNSTYNNIINNRAQNSTPLDLFRFNYAKTSYFPDLSYGHEGGAKGLSIDDGQSFIAEFSTGATASGGNSQQASHWNKGVNAIMTPTLSRGQRMNIAQIDLRTMDVVGWDLSTNGINTAFSLTTLQSQAKQALANRLGTTVSWLDSNQATAASRLGQNRATDIDTMIRNSTIYKWGSDGDAWWQRVIGLFQQRSLFSTLEDLKDGSNSQATDRPTIDFSTLLTQVSPIIPGLSKDWQPQRGEQALHWEGLDRGDSKRSIGATSSKIELFGQEVQHFVLCEPKSLILKGLSDSGDGSTMTLTSKKRHFQQKFSRTKWDSPGEP